MLDLRDVLQKAYCRRQKKKTKKKQENYETRLMDAFVRQAICQLSSGQGGLWNRLVLAHHINAIRSTFVVFFFFFYTFSLLFFLIFIFFCLCHYITNLAVEERDWENGLAAEANKKGRTQMLWMILFRMDKGRDTKMRVCK